MRTQEKIRAYIVDNFLFGDDRGLDGDSSLLENGIVDSTGILQLVAFIGEEYSIVVDDEEIIPENLDSINRVAAFVERKRDLVPLGLSISQ